MVGEEDGVTQTCIALCLTFFYECVNILPFNMAPKRKQGSSDGRAWKKRKAITMEMKLDIIERSKNGETATNIGRLLGLSRTTVATIKRYE